MMMMANKPSPIVEMEKTKQEEFKMEQEKQKTQQLALRLELFKHGITDF